MKTATSVSLLQTETDKGSLFAANVNGKRKIVSLPWLENYKW
jgi:hypothetical protein